MYERGIILSLLAIILVGNAFCEMTKIPVSEDVYINLGTGNEQVYNQTDRLLCSVNVTDMKGAKVSSYPGAPVIQFNISGLNITKDDVAILALKAEPMERQINDSALVALISIGSEWDEESDLTTFLVNLLPAWKIVKKNDMTGMSTNTDGDAIFAFDVSKKLLDAKVKGDKISFLLEAISNSSYEVNFLSKESGQGPYLMVVPYSANSLSNQTIVAEENTTLSSNNASLSYNMSEINMSEINNGELEIPVASNLQRELAAKQNLSLATNDSETSIGEMKVPATVSLQSDPKTNQNITTNQTKNVSQTESMNQSVEKRPIKGKNDI